MRKEVVIVLLILAVVTRFYALDARPMDHDESIHAYLSYVLLKDHTYSYDPAYHGPFLYFTTAGIFGLLGDSKFTARLVPVLFSIIAVFVALRFENFFRNSYVFALILLFSPSILYYSRYTRNDLIVLSSFIIAVYSYFSYRNSQKPVYIYLATIFSAVMVCAKENGYLYLGTFVSFVIFYRIYRRDFSVSKRFLKHFAVSLVIAGFIFSALYSAGFSDPEGLKRATIDSFAHWFKMHKTNDHWKPIWYYSKLIFEYEFLPLGMALAGIPVFVRRFRERQTTEIELFAFYWLVTAFVIYHVLSHKVPWLLVHLTAPMAFFGAIYAHYLNRKAGRAVFVAALIATVAVSGYLTYVDNVNTKHDLIYIQAQPDVEKLAERIVSEGKKTLIFVPGNDYWPLPWYLRHYGAGFSPSYYSGYEVVISTGDYTEFLKEKGYVRDGKYTIRPGHDVYWFELHQS
ncbi:flippase activity-associated protein Agl23 [Geoglobus acetivorans]|uniref:Glycosyltransferase RgtA/B/C/D-like domain-containing protein n=1 Tax=Geoglobus acetivorans TaxID=565033 RepID=A0A0A7GD01_GEOAI|nr:hypothetical protein GACE_0908 [Geoglobus acetivorans]